MSAGRARLASSRPFRLRPPLHKIPQRSCTMALTVGRSKAPPRRRRRRVVSAVRCADRAFHPRCEQALRASVAQASTADVIPPLPTHTPLRVEVATASPSWASNCVLFICARSVSTWRRRKNAHGARPHAALQEPRLRRVLTMIACRWADACRHACDLTLAAERACLRAWICDGAAARAQAPRGQYWRPLLRPSCDGLASSTLLPSSSSGSGEAAHRLARRRPCTEFAGTAVTSAAHTELAARLSRRRD